MDLFPNQKNCSRTSYFVKRTPDKHDRLFHDFLYSGTGLTCKTAVYRRNFACYLFLITGCQKPFFPFAMITPTILFSVMLVAALAVFSVYARATRPQLPPEPVR